MISTEILSKFIDSLRGAVLDRGKAYGYRLNSNDINELWEDGRQITYEDRAGEFRLKYKYYSFMSQFISLKTFHTFKSVMLAALLLPVHAAATETTDNTAEAEAPSVQVSLITCSPGRDIYELCGHTALRVRSGDMDMAVNYGIFDFNAPNFVYRFVKGETDYMVAAYPFEHFMEGYQRQGRSVTEQPLNLTSRQADSLIALLDRNLRPENRVYRYNYVKDNCSTRPLSMIERALGDTIALTAPSGTEGWSFRDAMRHYHKGYPWYQFGIDLALGSGIDYPISAREKAFAPIMLSEMLKTAVVKDSMNRKIPLAAGTRIISEGRPDGGPASPTPWYFTPMAAAIALLIITIVVTLRDLKRRKITRWYDFLIFSLYGTAGCVTAFLVLISVHEATSPNILLLWLNPLCLIIPACIFIKKCRRLVILYGIVNFVALILLTLMWPLSGQSINPAFIPLILTDAILTARYLYITRCDEKTTRD